jgi:putative ABC transport system permease protein
MEFITTKDLGYDQHQVVFIPTHHGWDDASDRFVENFRSSLSSETSVQGVAGTSIVFTHGTMTMGFQYDGMPKTASGYIVDHQYISTLGIELIAGRNFDVQNPADLKDAVIVNEALVREMKWSNPVGEHLNWKWEQGPGSMVIGVVKDHHYLSLEKNIEPMFLTMDKTFGHHQWILVKISTDDVPAAVKTLEKAYKQLAPDKPFEYTFLDENIRLQYKSYTRWMNIMSLTTAFAILISCLGLFGLAGISVVNRTKEIGIRKVLGAGLGSIFVLLNKQFAWLCALAFALAAYPAWYAMNQWLASFQFKIEISGLLFLISMGSGLAVAMIAVSYHTLKAGRVNPADTLKYE